MPNALKEIGKDLADMLVEQARDAGVELKEDIESVRAYAAERMAHLATCVGQPGYLEAVRAEAESVALESAGRAIDQADASDARLVSIIQGALAVGAKAISIAV